MYVYAMLCIMNKLCKLYITRYIFAFTRIGMQWIYYAWHDVMNTLKTKSIELIWRIFVQILVCVVILCHRWHHRWHIHRQIIILVGTASGNPGLPVPVVPTLRFESRFLARNCDFAIGTSFWIDRDSLPAGSVASRAGCRYSLAAPEVVGISGSDKRGELDVSIAFESFENLSQLDCVCGGTGGGGSGTARQPRFLFFQLSCNLPNSWSLFSTSCNLPGILDLCSLHREIFGIRDLCSLHRSTCLLLTVVTANQGPEVCWISTVLIVGDPQRVSSGSDVVSCISPSCCFRLHPYSGCVSSALAGKLGLQVEPELDSRSAT